MPEPEQQDMQRRSELRASANDEARHAPQQQRSRHSSQQKMMRDAHRKERRRQGAERRYEEEAQHAHRGPEGRRDVAAPAKTSEQAEDRKSRGEGKRGSVRVVLGGSRINRKKKKQQKTK